jgi:hypothetical protein
MEYIIGAAVVLVVVLGVGIAMSSSSKTTSTPRDGIYKGSEKVAILVAQPANEIWLVQNTNHTLTYGYVTHDGKAMSHRGGEALWIGYATDAGECYRGPGARSPYVGSIEPTGNVYQKPVIMGANENTRVVGFIGYPSLPLRVRGAAAVVMGVVH